MNPKCASCGLDTEGREPVYATMPWLPGRPVVAWCGACEEKSLMRRLMKMRRAAETVAMIEGRGPGRVVRLDEEVKA